MKRIVDTLNKPDNWDSLEKFFDYFFVESPCDDYHSDYLRKFKQFRSDAHKCVLNNDWEGMVQLANELTDLEDSMHEFELHND